MSYLPATMCELSLTLQSAVREALSYAPDDTIDLDYSEFKLHSWFSDTAHEVADDCVPICYSELAQLLEDDPSLGDGPEDLPTEPGAPVWAILQAAIYERLNIEAFQHAETVATFATQFAQGFVDALVWSERPDDPRERRGTPWDGTGTDNAIEHIDSDSLHAIRRDCLQFVCDNWEALMLAEDVRDAEHLGHDYALTRNGHGTSYWDREELSDVLVANIRGFERYADDPTVSVAGILSEAACKAGEVHLYEDDPTQPDSDLLAKFAS